MTKEVDLRDLFETMRVYLGSLYVNDFNRFGRTWQVIVQADAKFRNQPEDVKLLKVRNAHGTMLPVAALADFREITGPLVLSRYNMYPSAPINGNAEKGVSSGQAIEIMCHCPRPRQRAAQLDGLRVDRAGVPGTAGGQHRHDHLRLRGGDGLPRPGGEYESWSLPLAIILVVPMCLLSAVAGVKLAQG